MMREQTNQDGVDCRGAMEQLFDMLDGELTPEVERQMRTHMSGCPHCFTQADFERRFLEALRAARNAGVAPGALRDRVISALRAEGFHGAATP
jgi:anti-sigma factor (TIGR02949 family)